MIGSLQKTLAAGHPIVMRMHPAAQYPAEHRDQALRNDLEGQAVLIVGYDAEQRMFAVMDPWDNDWGGTRGGLRWLPYHHLALINVNQTLDCYMVAAPLDVRAESREDGTVDLEVGFFDVDGIVMDHESLAIEEVRVYAAGQSATLRGNWKVGERAELQLETHGNSGAELEIRVEAVVTCHRPYPFVDTIRTVKRCAMATASGEQRHAV